MTKFIKVIKEFYNLRHESQDNYVSRQNNFLEQRKRKKILLIRQVTSRTYPILNLKAH